MVVRLRKHPNRFLSISKDTPELIRVKAQSSVAKFGGIFGPSPSWSSDAVCVEVSLITQHHSKGLQDNDTSSRATTDRADGLILLKLATEREETNDGEFRESDGLWINMTC
ncbi:hypothetical protein T265_12378 [Opisthorchis viverrini]|uniref:Uncharacterized protein n=1 Tax=Opisthorchis viverrini TaxID=6198 RepID=A0A074YTI0_OPIVI|nr:hypothetical protein T265_12378 [Opisthorchis viverrini]KER18101.1 hypothetical protein T265_12378 [Opisthorchis viverrini]